MTNIRLHHFRLSRTLTTFEYVATSTPDALLYCGTAEFQDGRSLLLLFTLGYVRTLRLYKTVVASLPHLTNNLKGLVQDGGSFNFNMICFHMLWRCVDC
jgi:hypothetical protein